MSGWFLGDDSAFPKRCFWLTTGRTGKTQVATRRKICFVLWQWPTWVWRMVTPDPGPPEGYPSIEGVESDTLRDLGIVDAITWLSRRGSPEIARAFEPIAGRLLEAIQKRLPEGLSLAGDEPRY